MCATCEQHIIGLIILTQFHVSTLVRILSPFVFTVLTDTLGLSL